MERVYPHVTSFYEDLEIEEACKGTKKQERIIKGEYATTHTKHHMQLYTLYASCVTKNVLLKGSWVVNIITLSAYTQSICVYITPLLMKLSYNDCIYNYVTQVMHCIAMTVLCMLLHNIWSEAKEEISLLVNHKFTLHAVSMEILKEDVHTLKSGIKAVQLEMNKEPDNFITFISTKKFSIHVTVTYWKPMFQIPWSVFHNNPKA